MDLLVEHQAELASAGAIVTVLMGVIGVAKWAFGKKIEKCGEAHNDVVNVRNEAGAVASVNVNVVNLYGRARTGIELSRFTQTLDLAGVESITVSGDGGARETVTKSERGYFHREEGTILSDTEATMVLEIISPKFNGSPYGWQFSAGEGSHEFTARVEDEDFLKGVRDKAILIDNNTVITADLRIVQKKLKRMVEERSILEVIEVRSSTSD